MASFEDAVLATGGDSWNTWQVASLGGAEFVAFSFRPIIRDAI
tara:strand:- start:180 stop:308 length:129 start_codon:yes stop_codon:yes gene_type:complete